MEKTEDILKGIIDDWYYYWTSHQATPEEIKADLVIRIMERLYPKSQ